MLKISYFHTNTHTETFALLITCVIDGTLLFCSQAGSAYICAVGCQEYGEMKAGLVSVVPRGWLSLTLGEQQQEHCIALCCGVWC